MKEENSVIFPKKDIKGGTRLRKEDPWKRN
jgi:hypothetical protein